MNQDTGYMKHTDMSTGPGGLLPWSLSGEPPVVWETVSLS